MANPSVVLVTRASSGIGEAIAARLAKDGHQVFGTSRKGGGIRGNIELLTLDVRSDLSVQACVEGLLRQDGTHRRPGEQRRLPAERRHRGGDAGGGQGRGLETNFFGVVRMVQAVLPAMRRARSGRILSISSLAGLVPAPFWGFYDASEFAVERDMETLRLELAPFGIRVALVEPGIIRTPFYENPQAKPMPEYGPWRDRALKPWVTSPRRHRGPTWSPRWWPGSSRAGTRPLRTRVARDASLFPFLRWLLPASAFEAGTRRHFNLDREGF